MTSMPHEELATRPGRWISADFTGDLWSRLVIGGVLSDLGSARLRRPRIALQAGPYQVPLPNNQATQHHQRLSTRNRQGQGIWTPDPAHPPRCQNAGRGPAPVPPVSSANQNGIGASTFNRHPLFSTLCRAAAIGAGSNQPGHLHAAEMSPTSGSAMEGADESQKAAAPVRGGQTFGGSSRSDHHAG